jgi:glycosidase
MWAIALGTVMATSDFDRRREDWRMGAVVYQVFPDRFVPPSDFESKSSLYAPPSTRHPWTETPVASTVDNAGEYPHTRAFWGGDLDGVRTKLDYLRDLGADVLYLNPIFEAPSNHKYDTEDYFRVDDQLGGDDAFRRLLTDAKSKRVKVILDGVFNHMGITSPVFRNAQANAANPRRDWFVFSQEFPRGYRAWFNVPSLPAWNVDNKAVRDYLWNDRDSVVQHYLRMGIDGWRLDVAFELGPDFLEELTRASHRAKPGSVVIGEISGYPSDWSPSVDGVFNFAAINLGIEATKGKVSGGRYGAMMQDMVDDAGLDSMLKSWLLTDNHDTPRFATVVPNVADRRVIQALQMTLPGSPCIYYGSELGMTGGGDPECRAPMRWDLAKRGNPDYDWVRKLLAVRKSAPALRLGDFRALATDKLIGFTRTTDVLAETMLVVMNPTDAPVTETFTTRLGRILSWGEFEDVLGKTRTRSVTGMFDVTLAPKEVRVYRPVLETMPGYSVYDRVKKTR